MTPALFSGDFHCGHKTALTPPEWQYDAQCTDPALRHIGDIQRALWGFWVKVCEEVKPEVLIINGDVIDGKGERSGSTELLTTDRREQCKMALEAVKVSGAKRVQLIYGTPYHTGQDEDWEAVLCDMIDSLPGVSCRIGSHEAIKIEEVTIDLKHKIGSSGIPHGRATAIEKERLWSELWKERGMFPDCDILMRSHVHYYKRTEGFRHVNMTLPCLQWDTKYGKRQCSGTIDLGVVAGWFNGRDYGLRAIELDMKFAKVEAVGI